jgi:uncharacterized membrane protein YcfT
LVHLLLPVFFVVTKLAHDKGIPWQIMLAAAVILQMAPIQTGWLVIDEFASRFVFFYTGYIFAPKIFALADWVRERVGLSLAILAAGPSSTEVWWQSGGPDCRSFRWCWAEQGQLRSYWPAP